MRFKSYNLPLKGTTLVETLLFAAIGSVILIAMSAIYFSGLNSRTLIDAQQRLLTVDQFVFATLQSTIISASSITQPVSGSDTQLAFYSSEEASTLTFFRTATNLSMTIGGQEPLLLNTLGVRVIDFQVTRLFSVPDAVRVAITYEVDTTSGRVIQYQNAFTFLLRYE